MLIATTTLALSIFGLTFLIGFKWWEVKTGRLILPNARARVSERVHQGIIAARSKAPALASRISSSWGDLFREAAKFIFVRSLVISERILERILKNLKRVERMHRGGEASSFLREVAEHKKQLREREGIE